MTSVSAPSGCTLFLTLLITCLCLKNVTVLGYNTRSVHNLMYHDYSSLVRFFVCFVFFARYFVPLHVSRAVCSWSSFGSLSISFPPSLCRCSWRSLTWSCGPRSRARAGRRGSGSGKRTRLTSTPTGTGREGREGRSAAEDGWGFGVSGGDAASCGTSMNDKPITLHWLRYRRGGKLLLSAETSLSCFCSLCLSFLSFFNWKGTMSHHCLNVIKLSNQQGLLTGFKCSAVMT